MATYELREEGQDEGRIAEYVEMFRECPEDVAAIVVIDGTVYDGHHRYLASRIAGVEPKVSTMTEAQYRALLAENFDLFEIVATAHYLSGNETAIDTLNLQFPGADCFGDALRGADLLGAA